MNGLIILIIWISFTLNFYSQGFESDHFTIQKLDDGVYAVIHKIGGYAICNAGIVNLGNETIVFDCFISPEAARDLRKAAEELTGNPVKYLINSHFHNDHIRGNQVFADAEIISTRRTRELIEQNEPENLEWEKSVVDQRIETTLQKISEETDTSKLEEHKMWLGYYMAIKASFDEYKTTLPDYIMDDTLKIEGSERSALLFSKGKGHTESDLVLWLPEEKILFTGDLLFIECHPWLGDGFMKEWIDYLNNLKKLNPFHIVPGHGPVGKAMHLDQMINYIKTVSEIVDTAIEKNLTEDELATTPVPDEFSSWWFERFFPPTLVSVYKSKSGGRNK